MSKTVSDVPVKVCEVRAQLGVSSSYMTALLKHMGIPGARRISMKRVVQWLDNHRGWKMTDKVEA